MSARHSSRPAWDVFDPRDGLTRRTFRTRTAARLYSGIAWRRARRPFGERGAHIAIAWDYAPHGTGHLPGA